MNEDTESHSADAQGDNVKHFTTHQSFFCVRACLVFNLFLFFFTFLCGKNRIKTKTNLYITIYVRVRVSDHIQKETDMNCGYIDKGKWITMGKRLILFYFFLY